MSEDTQTQSEREELVDLIQHPGFARFIAHLRKEWGAEGYALKLKQAVRTAKERGEDPSAAVERIDFTSDAVNAVASWPQARVAQLDALKKPSKVPFLSRRRA